MGVGGDLDLRKVAPICELVPGVCRRFLEVSMWSGRLAGRGWSRADS
jgi:hypothetical protein